MRFIGAAIAAAAIISLAVPALADVTGLVRGTVSLDGKPVSGAVVAIDGEGSRYAATSDVAGHYAFAAIPFGQYRVTVHVAGQPDQSRDVTVSSGSVSRIDFAVSKLKNIATVKINPNQTAGGTPVSQNSLDKQQLAVLPNNTSLNSIVETVPGIVTFSYGEPVAHGFHGVTYEIDGAPLPLATSSNFAEVIDPKDVDRVEVLTGAFPAEYGGGRQGAVINILTNGAGDLIVPSQGHITVGAGNQGQAIASLDEAFKAGASAVFFNTNVLRTNRGLDAPTFDPIHDDSSQADQFLRFVSPANKRDSVALNLSNQLAQFQIPINTDPNNPNDPQVSVPGTDDVQREYDRYASLNFTRATNDLQGQLQIIPWVRSTRVAFDGDLPLDVLATLPNPTTGAPTNLAGLRQDRRADYVGIRASDFRATEHHEFKVGADVSRETFSSTQTFAQFQQPSVTASVSQAGSQIGLYAQDKWSPSRAVTVNYGLRYDHSTGFVSGNQLSPRLGVNLAPDSTNVLHFYYGKLYAAPQLEDVRQDCVLLQGCNTEPVYDLKPETDYYGEMGIAHTFSPTLHGYVNYWERNAVNVLDTTQFLNTPIFAVFNNAVGRANGIEFRLDGRPSAANSWFFSGTVSQALASGISGSTFLFPASSLSATSLQPEDHDQTYAAESAFTHRFGRGLANFATLEADYGSGYPVQFQNGSGRLPTHLLFALALGRRASGAGGHDLGFDLSIDNLLDHQYVIKIANGFNTTQIADRRKILFRVTAPFGGS